MQVSISQLECRSSNQMVVSQRIENNPKQRSSPVSNQAREPLVALDLLSGNRRHDVELRISIQRSMSDRIQPDAIFGRLAHFGKAPSLISS